MKYIMLIYQGTALERQAALPEEEQKTVYADYQGINQTPGVTPGLPMGLPQTATTVRVEGGKTLTTDGPFIGMKEAVGGMFIATAVVFFAMRPTGGSIPSSPLDVAATFAAAPGATSTVAAAATIETARRASPAAPKTRAATQVTAVNSGGLSSTTCTRCHIQPNERWATSSCVKISSP